MSLQKKCHPMKTVQGLLSLMKYHIENSFGLTNRSRISGVSETATGKRLKPYGIHTMGDVARCSIENEELLYKLFGVNAELLIDHAWGYEPTEIKYIHQYKPENNSLGSGQVLQKPYTHEKAAIIVREMTELLVLDLVKKRLVTDQMVLTINYDRTCLEDPEIRAKYKGEVTKDHYGRKTPKHAHGTVNLDHYMSSSKIIVDAVVDLYERITEDYLLVRRVNIAANHRDIRKRYTRGETYGQTADYF